MPTQLWMSDRCFDCGVERIEPSPEAGSWIIKTKARRYFRFDAASKVLLCQLMALDRLDADAPRHATFMTFLKVRLLPLGIYQARGEHAPAPSATGALRWQRQLLAAPQVRRVAAVLSPLFSPWLLWPMLGLCLWAHASHLVRTHGLISYQDCLSYSPQELLLLVIVAIARGLLHEFGHAAACWRLTRSVGAIGFGVFIATPVLYCDVSDIHLLPRHRKALVGMAGTVMDIAFLAALVTLGGSLPIVMKIYCLSLLAVLLNLLPFYRNDGFWVLNDLAGSDDLLQDTLQACRTGRASVRQWGFLAFTAACGLIVASLAAAFALQLGPVQVAEAVRLLPSFAGAVLALVTTLQYAALVFGVLAVVKTLARAARHALCTQLPHIARRAMPATRSGAPAHQGGNRDLQTRDDQRRRAQDPASRAGRSPAPAMGGLDRGV